MDTPEKIEFCCIILQCLHKRESAISIHDDNDPIINRATT